MSLDIANIVGGWNYDSDEVHARWIDANDGMRKLQLRLDLGVFQMEAEGRPDGVRPKGFDSWLSYYIEQERKAADGVLSERWGTEVCAAMQQEIMQYHYRLMAFQALGEWGGVQEDSDHALDIIDMVSEYATDDEVAWQFTQLYPHMSLMNTRARVEQLTAENRYRDALEIVQSALGELEQFYKENFEQENEDGTPAPPPSELEAMRELKKKVEERRPRSEDETLREELDRAIALENYERAAILRDRLKACRGSKKRVSRSEAGGKSE